MKDSHHAHGWLQARLPEWQAEGLLDAAAVAALRQRYPVAPSRSRPWMGVVLGILGSLLVAGGIILLFAHNWHGLSRGLRTVLAVAPLFAFQFLGGWTLWRRPASVAWREGVGAGLTLSIGAAIALVAQTYQLGGDFGRFMLSWTLLTLPVIFLLRSGSAFWLYLLGAVIHAGHGATVGETGALFCVLLAAAVPFSVYVHHRAAHPTLALLSRLALALAFWVGMPLAVGESLGAGWLPFFGLAAGAMILWDRPEAGERVRPHRHPFALTGGFFLAGSLLAFSFEGAWREFTALSLPPDGNALLLAVLGLAIAGAWLTGLIRRGAEGRLWPVALAAGTGGLFLLGGTAGDGWTQALMLATNALGFALGLGAIGQALRQNRLELLNFGLLLVGGLIVLRFFDAELGFVARGLGFIALGAGLLGANCLFLRRRPARTQT